MRRAHSRHGRSGIPNSSTLLSTDLHPILPWALDPTLLFFHIHTIFTTPNYPFPPTPDLASPHPYPCPTHTHLCFHPCHHPCPHPYPITPTPTRTLSLIHPHPWTHPLVLSRGLTVKRPRLFCLIPHFSLSSLAAEKKTVTRRTCSFCSSQRFVAVH